MQPLVVEIIHEKGVENFMQEVQQHAGTCQEMQEAAEQQELIIKHNGQKPAHPVRDGTIMRYRLKCGLAAPPGTVSKVDLLDEDQVPLLCCSEASKERARKRRKVVSDEHGDAAGEGGESARGSSTARESSKSAVVTPAVGIY